jgi:hypothetical protein
MGRLYWKMRRKIPSILKSIDLSEAGECSCNLVILNLNVRSVPKILCHGPNGSHDTLWQEQIQRGALDACAFYFQKILKYEINREFRKPLELTMNFTRGDHTVCRHYPMCIPIFAV